jgi:hypothetical protein
MKHLRLYEDVRSGPRVGDYVICIILIDISGCGLEDSDLFKIDNSVGFITENDESGYQQYFVEYDEGFKYVEGWWFDKSEILFFSSNKKECENKLPIIIFLIMIVF